MNTMTHEVDTYDSSTARSAIYGVVAAMFRSPDDPLFRHVSSCQEMEAIQEALTQSGNQISDELRLVARQLYEEAQEHSRDELLHDFIRLFGHTSRGAAPPYETEYGGGGPFYQPQELSDIAGFYGAFGLKLDSRKNERMDHICCECEFMCFLCARQTYALESNDRETVDEVLRTQRLFLRDHTGAFARTFFGRVQEQTSNSWHAAAARFASLFLDTEFERFELAINREYLTLRPDQEVNVPMACGSCEGQCGSVLGDGE